MTAPGRVLALLLAARALAGAAESVAPAAGYAPDREHGDTLRVRHADAPAPPSTATALGSVVAGYLSPSGLPPRAGVVLVTDTGLVFRSDDGGYSRTLPVVGPVRGTPQGRWRASAVTLVYVDQTLGRPAYLFRVDGGVFETDAPGALLELARHPAWLDTVGSREWRTDLPLVAEGGVPGARALLQRLVRTGYADTLFALFGRPGRAVGLVGARGRAAGRLGEYVATRDSLALDPARMSSEEQLRHTLAHELAHRWQAHSPEVLATLWQGVPPIRDPKRYGYGNPGEQQAEAAAFAVHFLLATAHGPQADRDLVALDHYELLVPGTRTLARYFALQPAFRGHPLRRRLTGTAPAPTS